MASARGHRAGRRGRVYWSGPSWRWLWQFYPSLPAAKHQINATTVASSNARFSVQIPSLDCPPCAKGIEATPCRAPGVRQVAVDYDTKAPVPVYDSSVTNHDRLLALIDASGFPTERSILK